MYIRSSLHLVGGLLLSATLLSAQTSNTAYFPDKAIGGVSGQYPLFTPSNGNTVRLQEIVPGTFLDKALFGTGTKGPRIVSRIGIQIAGQEDYATFEIRVGVTKSATMSTTFGTNLNQPVPQVNLNGTKLLGGLTGTTLVNKWVFYDLSYPFIWQPGQNVCVDFISKSKVSGTFCRTARDTAALRIPRLRQLAYTSATKTGTLLTTGGIQFALGFEASNMVVVGSGGCAGSSGSAPVLGASGAVKSPGVVTLSLSKAPNNAAAILAGGVMDPVGRFGDCVLRSSAEVLIFTKASAAGAVSRPLPLGNIPKALKGFVIHMQWAVADTPKSSTLPFTLSNPGRLILP